VNLLLAVVLGVAIGVTLGALGGGGAILAVPVLTYLLHQSPHEAIAGSLLIVGLSSLVAATSHARRGNLRLVQGLIFGGLGIVGNVLGSWASQSMPGRLLLGLFAVLMFVVAALMVLKLVRPSKRAETAEVALVEDGHIVWPRLVKLALVATAVGALTGFFGVGGGFMIVPALALVLRFPMKAAVGTSLLVIAINSATAFVSRLAQGISLDWPLIGTFTAAAVAGSLVGAWVATKVRAKTLQAAFAVLLLAVAGYTAFQVITG